jgi:arginine decarboxylase
LSRLGQRSHVDVGGGLGVDYEGTRSRSYCSINYGLDQYASSIVERAGRGLRRAWLVPPHVITESGRAMTAHHAVLVANVSRSRTGTGRPRCRRIAAMNRTRCVMRHLRELHEELPGAGGGAVPRGLSRRMPRACRCTRSGEIEPVQRARSTTSIYAIAHAVKARLKPTTKKRIATSLDELNESLVDKYFVNFSVFESMPDVWAIDQVFPIMPIERLDDESPTGAA